MAKRQFRDERGTHWDVWDVSPGDTSTGAAYDRRAVGREGGTPPPKDTPTSTRAFLDPDLEQGWLCFQSGHDRRRFAPIPPAWLELPDAVLRVMVDIATPVSSSLESPHQPKME